ncbi:MAG: serine/threonine protein kinase [Rhodospirillales bacterium]|nr:serine/threonine protein kinase [Rhodospirillales bacterium]
MDFGDYQEILPLNRGPVTSVSLVTKKNVDGYYAAKQCLPLPPEIMAQVAPGYENFKLEELHKFFEVESKILQAFDHPNIAKILEVGKKDDGTPYFIMPYYPITLRKAIWVTGMGDKPSPRRLSPETFYQYMSDILSGLDALHRKGIVHRDLKFINLQFDQKGRVVVCDFGMARWERDFGFPIFQETVFMCPELKLHPSRAEPFSDVYSVGVMGFRMLTGRFPRGQGNSPYDVDPTIHRGFSNFVKKAIDKNPANRPQNAGELRLLLEEAKG